MLRLVIGLGTRAVDRLSRDYAKIVALDSPEKAPPINHGDERRFSQHGVDVLNIRENSPSEISIDEFYSQKLSFDKSILFRRDEETAKRLRELGMQEKTPVLADFKNLLSRTDFPLTMKRILTTLEEAYDYPVDTEYTVNFYDDGSYKVNILQCRPLQTRSIGGIASLSKPVPEKIVIETSGNFMGGNVIIPMDYAIIVKPLEYLALAEQEKYTIARTIGKLNHVLSEKHTILIGPGRWGTTTPSLGVPVHFTELSRMSAICEVSLMEKGLMPELSFGSHFFQDIVETGIFYLAVFSEDGKDTYNAEQLLDKENNLLELIDSDPNFSDVIHVVKTPGLILHSDVPAQKLRLFWK